MSVKLEPDFYKNACETWTSENLRNLRSLILDSNMDWDTLANILSNTRSSTGPSKILIF